MSNAENKRIKGKFQKGHSGNPSTQFSKDNQPPPENKSKGMRRIKTLKEMFSIYGQFKHEEVMDDAGNDIEITKEAAVIKKLIDEAIGGNIKSASLLADIMGWKAATTLNLKTDVAELIKTGSLELKPKDGEGTEDVNFETV